MLRKRLQEINFYNPQNQKFSIDELIGEIVNYINREPSRFYRIVVGSDTKAVSETRVTTAVAVLKVGNGGRYFISHSPYQEFFSLKERIYKEAVASATLAQEIRSRLKEKLGEDFFWNNNIVVHIDVGERGPTQSLIDGLKGMVRGFGFEPVIKPEAFAAFVLADRHT